MKTPIKQGVDCATPLTSETIPNIHSYGYDIAMRYLVPEKYDKRITKEEAWKLTNNNMLIGVVFETSGTSPKLGYPQGVKDAQSAIECALELGLPQDACIYFAVDYQPTSTQDMYNISNYFIGVKSVITTYLIGAYGCYDVIEWLHRQNICSCYWQCMAWSYGKISEFATMYQKTSGRVIGGVNVDINDIYENIGFWNYNTVTTKNNIVTVKAIVNGVESSLRSVIIKDEHYIRIRDLTDIDNADALTVTWDDEKQQMIITTK